MTDQSWSHLWYIYSLIGIYLLLPFYKKIADNSTKKEMEILILILLVFRSVFPYLDNQGISSGFLIFVTGIYPLYLFLGHYLYTYGEFFSKSLLWAVFIITTVVLFEVSMLDSFYTFDFTDGLFSYNSLLVILQAGTFFTLLMRAKTEDRKTWKITELTAGYSFGIYMVHMIFLRLLVKILKIDIIGMFGIVGIVPIIIMVYLLSLLLSMALKKTPVFRKIV